MNNYRPDIDGLRAFSIIAVVVYHAFPTLLPGGFVGVDVFFVISGYLITGIILQGQAKAKFSIIEFYRRRIQRIIPALLLVLLFCLIAGWWVLLPYEYAMLGQQTAASSVFAPNILFWTEAGYFDTNSKLKPLLHLWSLGVEEQFYLLWPLALLLAARWPSRIVFIIAGLALLSFSMGIAITNDNAASFFLPQFRVWELLLGALIAALPLSRVSVTANNLTAMVGLGLLMCAVVFINRERDFPGWWALLPTFGAVLLIWSGPSHRLAQLMGSSALVLIGKISFPLYLWHWPLLTFARIMEQEEPSVEIRLVAVTISVLLAWLSYRQVESRLRYHPGRYTPMILLACLFTLGAAGYAIFKKDGFPERTAELNASAGAFYWQELGLHERDDCSEALGVAGRCLSDGKPPQIAVIGDSHSTNTFFALAHHYRSSNIGVVRLGRGGCPPLYGVAVQDSGNLDFCNDVTRSHLDWAIHDPALTTVYLSSMGPMYLNQKQPRYVLRDNSTPKATNNRLIFANALDKTIAMLLAANKKVVLVIDWPGLGFDPKTCLDIRPVRLSGFKPRDCEIPRQRHNKRESEYRQIILNAWQKNPQTLLWDTTKAFCDAKKCYGMLDGKMLYRDPAHLSMEGSRHLAEALELEAAPAKLTR
ncbi:MAG: acyltransferase [Halieaceae bacterium]|jgi:peptidoglycan/LPS O-acetylase OafA/YrhL|nr:acyltransferase [Halieaceae bacterium]